MFFVLGQVEHPDYYINIILLIVSIKSLRLPFSLTSLFLQPGAIANKAHGRVTNIFTSEDIKNISLWISQYLTVYCIINPNMVSHWMLLLQPSDWLLQTWLCNILEFPSFTRGSFSHQTLLIRLKAYNTLRFNCVNRWIILKI